MPPNRKGKNNPNYKKGTSTYRREALKRFGARCRKCGSGKNLRVHHKSGNAGDNRLSNLKVLCASCHTSHVRSGKHATRKDYASRIRSERRRFRKKGANMKTRRKAKGF